MNRRRVVPLCATRGSGLSFIFQTKVGIEPRSPLLWPFIFPNGRSARPRKQRQGCHRYLQSRPPDHQSDQCCLPQPEACHPVLGISSLAATSDCAQTGDERVRTVARPITMVGALCPVSFSDCWLPHGGRPFERLVSRQCLSLSPVEPGQHVVDTFSVGDGSAQNAATRRGRPRQRGFC